MSKRHKHPELHISTGERGGRLAPQAEDLEEMVLGGAILEKIACETVLELLNPKDFYKPEFRLIFEAIQELAKESAEINTRSVTYQLQKMEKIEQAGGRTIIVELTGKFSNAGDVRWNCMVIKQMTILREIIAASYHFQDKAWQGAADAPALLKEWKDRLEEIENNLPSKKGQSLKDGLNQLTIVMQNRLNSTTGISGIPSGFPKLDAMTDGWQNGDLIIIAARPGMGKTALAVLSALNAAIMFNEPVGIFSLEMVFLQLIARIVSMECEIELEIINRKQMTTEQWQQYLYVATKIAKAPVFIDDTPGLTLTELRIKATRMKQEHDIKALFIDYLQLMSGEGDENQREQEIAGISRGLKALAKLLNIPIIALAQLSRAVETRGGLKRPILADLRESGAIEQDADIVIFMWRPEYYAERDNRDWFKRDDIGEYIPGATLLDIAKFRNGATGTTFLKFIGRFTKFVNVDSQYVGWDDPAPAAPPSPDLFTTSRAPEVDPKTGAANNDDTPF